MKIQLDDRHFLNSDSFCYWLTSEFEQKNGKRIERRVGGYYRNLLPMFESVIEARVRKNDAKSIGELIEEVEQIKADLKKWESMLEQIEQLNE